MRTDQASRAALGRAPPRMQHRQYRHTASGPTSSIGEGEIQQWACGHSRDKSLPFSTSLSLPCRRQGRQEKHLQNSHSGELSTISSAHRRVGRGNMCRGGVLGFSAGSGVALFGRHQKFFANAGQAGKWHGCRRPPYLYACEIAGPECGR